MEFIECNLCLIWWSARQTMRDGHLIGIPSHPSIFSLTKGVDFLRSRILSTPAVHKLRMTVGCLLNVFLKWCLDIFRPRDQSPLEMDGGYSGGMMCGREFVNRLYRFSICYQMACLYQSILFFYLECHPVENEWMADSIRLAVPCWMAVERKWADCQQRQIFSTLCPVPKLICGFFSSSHLLSKIIHFSKYHPRWSFCYKKQTISVLN